MTQKHPCDMNCLHCKFNDCINNAPMTKEERDILRRAHIQTADMDKQEREKLYAQRRNARRRKKVDD